MSDRLNKAVVPRLRRASFVLLPAGLVIGACAIGALVCGFVSTNEAAGLLALSFVLVICGADCFRSKLDREK
mgnify:CR=1 FL=1